MLLRFKSFELYLSLWPVFMTLNVTLLVRAIRHLFEGKIRNLR